FFPKTIVDIFALMLESAGRKLSFYNTYPLKEASVLCCGIGDIYGECGDSQVAMTRKRKRPELMISLLSNTGIQPLPPTFR
ncbi:hypothetical protein S83_054573, partial [Arachis hypogaea]